MKDPYAVLGVPRSASQSEIKAAYRKLARRYHPDSKPGDAQAESRFKQIAAAYDLIGESAKRRAFDEGHGARADARADTRAHGAQAKARSGFRWGAGRNPFSSRERQGQSKVKVRGANVDYTLTVSLNEATQGTTRYINLTQGTRLKVAVPPGTRDGQVLRLKGQGLPGLGGGEAGDALVSIRLALDPEFRIDGQNVHAEVGISLQEAILGGTIQVRTLDGLVSLTVPPESNTGRTLRLKGKGLNKDGMRGDQYVRLKVMLPAKPDSELIAFIKRWGAKHDYPIPGRPEKS